MVPLIHFFLTVLKYVFFLLCQSYLEAGFVKMTYGSDDSLVDFLHGDNFCQAHIKAGEALLAPDSPVVGPDRPWS